MKIYTLMIQLSTLVFYSFYFFCLEHQLGDLSLYGGHSFEEDGMFNVDIWVEDQFVDLIMNDLYIPRSVGFEYLDLVDYQAFIEENPDGYYLMSTAFADGLQAMSQSKKGFYSLYFNSFFFFASDCRLKRVGSAFEIYNLNALGLIQKEEILELNEAILETMLYDSRWIYYIPAEDFLEPEEIVCTEPKSIESFVYSLSDFYELWIIFAIGVSISLGVHIIKLMIYYKKIKSGKFVFKGVRSNIDR